MGADQIEAMQERRAGSKKEREAAARLYAPLEPTDDQIFCKSCLGRDVCRGASSCQATGRDL